MQLDLTWNTGRPYAMRGQIIHAVAREDGSVLFADHSRGIDGYIPATKAPTRYISKTDFKSFVMDCYDHGEYESNHDSWHFLMMQACPEVNC